MSVNALERNKDRLLEYQHFWEQIARKNKRIGHTDAEKHFFRYNFWEMHTSKVNDLKGPFLGLETPRVRRRNDNGSNILKVWMGAIVVAKHYEPGNSAQLHAAMDECGLIMDQIVGLVDAMRYKQQVVNIRFSEDVESPVLEVFGNHVGYRKEFELVSQFDMRVLEDDWTDIDITEPDLYFATVNDQGAIVKLRAGDGYTCPILPDVYTVLSDSVWPYIYTGKALEGTLSSDASWTVTRMEILNDNSFNLTTATGPWDDRLTLIYT